MLSHARILIVRLSSIGDVLHATTVAHNLKQSYPDCHLTWIVSRTAAELLQYNPDIDEVFIWSREDFEQALHQRQFGKILHSIQLLRDFFSTHPFDIALDIHGLFMSGVITWLSKAPRRIGMSGTRELNWLFMNEFATPSQSPHKIKHYLSVLESFAGNKEDYRLILKLPTTLSDFAIKFFDENQVDTRKKILMVNPWTSWRSKNWGIENFAQCLTQLPDTIEILLCGGPADEKNNQKIIAATKRPLIDITGKTRLLELAALFSQADLVLTGDTGALHIATALNIPTISLWGPTHPRKYGPLVPGHTFICSENTCCNCDKTKCRLQTNACMNSISPNLVSEKIIDLFMKKRPSDD